MLNEIKTDEIKERVLREIIELIRPRKELMPYTKEHVINLVSGCLEKAIDLTIQECSKERDSLIDEARNLFIDIKSDKKASPKIDNFYDCYDSMHYMKKIYDFAEKISKMKKSGE